MKFARVLVLALLCAALGMALPQTGHAQFGKLKDKAKKEVEKKIEGDKTKPEEQKEAKEETEEAGKDSAKADSTGAPADEFQLYTKFDFVPGQTVLYYDDLAGEEIAEFPSRWSLDEGVFEIAKVGKESWIMASTRGAISPKLGISQFPEKYTVEYEFLNRTTNYNGGHHIKFAFMGEDGYPVARLEIVNNDQAYFYMHDDKGDDNRISDKQVPAGFEKGIHTIRAMVTKSTVKIYIDNERMVNAPRTAGFLPVGFQLGFYAGDEDFEMEKMFFRNFRFAEGGKTMREQLDESGKIITHGIYFDVNSDQIKGESYRTLADIGTMLTDDPALKLSIEGHTDSDGDDASNLDLSKRRAESVKAYLVANAKVDAGRLEAKGHGETKPIDVNTTSEGKANNRRVELVKI